MREKQCIALQEERDVLSTELQEAYVAKDDLVRKAWEARDQAVRRKSAAELELAKARIDVLQTNSQLLESIQHKVRLSCQLDQWQSDMQELLDAEIQKKLSRTERKSSTDPSTTSAPPPRGRISIMRLFGRS
ncbi:bicaudal D-related protein homolog [Pollicipes pollicipes]|nr:bicaudal D-related protein homolog [Pollicipes pollicipes]